MSATPLKICHLSQTPLVGSPSKLAAAQRRIGLDATAVVLNDYPKKGPLANKFIDNTLVWADADKLISKLIQETLSEADIVHIHNDIPQDIAKTLRALASRAAFVYQVHSPLREGPLYAERAGNIDLPFAEFLAVAQYHPRHYRFYRPVPNIVLDLPSIRPRNDGEPLRVLFSPSHTRGGRWNSKYSASLEACIKHLQGLGLIEVVWPEHPLHPAHLMALRRRCHVSIDEIVTGAFHQVSLEGLCAGNVVVNRADYFSKAMLANCTESLEMPPFLFADDHSVNKVLLDLALDCQGTAELQLATYRYFSENLAPEKMAGIYRDIYQELV